MATDYRKRPPGGGRGAQPRKKRSNRGNVPGWVWMLGGFLPGMFLAALVYQSHERTDRPPAATDPLAAVDTTAPDDSGDARPRFEFYKLLSEMEVVVPDEPEDLRRRSSTEPTIPTTPSQPSESATQPGEPGVQYLVQAGSFRNHGDADRLKARLALLGVEAEIQSVQIHGGETWHRVRIGPLSDRSRVDAVRKRLEQEKVESILLRLQG
ncbi:MAG: SPOR domain-containing protein [Aquisalimonadaceae bacterium]